MIKQIVIVDDDEINNMICGYVIKSTKVDLMVQTFSVPELGFDYFQNEFSNSDLILPTILFLDINMPTWSGWEFLEKFEKLNDDVKAKINIYMLTSSLDQKDKENAHKNKYVIDYLVKPLTVDIVKQVLINNTCFFN